MSQIILVCIFRSILSYFVKWLFLAIFTFYTFLVCRTSEFGCSFLADQFRSNLSTEFKRTFIYKLLFVWCDSDNWVGSYRVFSIYHVVFWLLYAKCTLNVHLTFSHHFVAAVITLC